MQITLDIPEGYELRGFCQEAQGFRAYIGPRGKLYLQGALSKTPQGAVDLALAACKKGEAFIVVTASSDLTIDDLDF